jgi:hypothetical protein
MLSSLPDLQKERGFPHPSRKKKLLKFKRESTYPEPSVYCFRQPYRRIGERRGILRAMRERAILEGLRTC